MFVSIFQDFIIESKMMKKQKNPTDNRPVKPMLKIFSA